MNRRVRAVAGLVAAGVAMVGVPLRAQVVLTFEGLKNQEAVLNYYNGGAGSLGSTGGGNYGVTFSSNALAIIRGNAGGSGNFGGEPSPSTVLYFLSGNAATLNSSSGFTTGFSFFYSAINNPGTIRVFDGLNATGNVLATLNLAVTPSTPGQGACANNPTGAFCPFVPIGVSFGGTARSIDFGGTVNQIGFDNITFGSAVPMGTVPEPGTIALVAVGLTGLAGVVRARRRSAAA